MHRVIECEGWTWRQSIGLFYGTGPNDQYEQVLRPRMTSPYWVVASEYENALPPELGVKPGTGTFVRTFPSAKAAMEFVAQKAEIVL